MTNRRMVLILLATASAVALVVAVIRLGPKGAGEMVALVGAALSALTALAGLCGVQLPGGITPAAVGSGDSSARRDPGGATAVAGRRRRIWLAAGVVCILLAGAGLLFVPSSKKQPSGEKQPATTQADGTPTPIPPAGAGPDGPTGPTPTGTAQPGDLPTTGTVVTGRPEPTQGPRPPDDDDPVVPAPSRTKAPPRPTTPGAVTSKPWIAPAGTPEWTILETDGVRFMPRPQLERGVGAAPLALPPDSDKVNFDDWTDSPDLSYAGCRASSADRWDSLDLRLVSTPATYCRREPEDPTQVSYVQFLAVNLSARPRYIKIKVWVYRP